MKILHICPHLGGGVGSVLMGWMDQVIAANDHNHRIVCLDYANEKAKKWALEKGFPLTDQCAFRPQVPEFEIGHSDIVLVHYWDKPILTELFSRPIPPCRLVFWSHKNHEVPQQILSFPDLFLDVSPIQGHGRHIWSTGGVDRFLKIQPKSHEGFNIGYVGWVSYRKIHPEWLPMCREIKKAIPDARFTFVGENLTAVKGEEGFTFTGLVDDVASYLAEFDIFGYALRPDHFGTSEQVLGEAMAAGVVPVCMDNPAERLICGEATARTEKEYIRMIEMLYQVPEMRKVLSEKVRQRAKQLYSLDTMISQWDDTFEEMMEQPKRKRGTL